MKADRVKHPVEFGWYVGAGAYVTQHAVMPKGDIANVALLPMFGFNLVRNYTDRTFLWFNASGGAPIVNVSSSGSAEVVGPRFAAVVAGGRELVLKKKFHLSIIGGIDIRWVDLYSPEDQSSIRSSKSAGGFGWAGLGFNFKITDRQNIFLLTRAGLGGFGIDFSGTNGDFVPAIGILGSIRIEHSAMLFGKTRVFYFGEVDIPFYNAINSTVRYGNTWFDKLMVEFGVGFAFGL